MKLPSGKILASIATVVVFLGGSLAIFVYLMDGAGFRVPVVQKEPYHVAVEVPDADNLVDLGQVRIAGVPVGKVRDVSLPGPGKPALVKVAFDDAAAPLHEGVRFRVGERSAVGESYLDVVDGKGPEIPAGATLPSQAVQGSTQLRDLLASLDQRTRSAMRDMMRSLDAGTHGTRDDTSATLAGLGRLGRQGHTALDAAAAQSEDLRSLARSTTTLVRALDTGEGQLTTLVANAHRVTRATAGQRQAIESTMRQLPGTLGSAETATRSLSELSGALSPVAAGLAAAAPDLSTALRQLPAATSDLRGLLPALDGSLHRAPGTLGRVPTFAQDVRNVVPEMDSILADINPMLSYLEPYGHDFAGYIANFNATLAYTDEAGNHYLRLIPKVNERSAESPLPVGVLTHKNPFPAPDKGDDPGPFEGKYPRVEREPR